MIELISQTLPNALYLLFCTLAVVCSVGVIALKNPVSSAFSLILVLLNVAGIFAFQQAYFISAVQILVYAGAIMVLFVFVIMLLSIDEVEMDWVTSKRFWPFPMALGTAFFSLMVFVFLGGQGALVKSGQTPEAITEAGGNVKVISLAMFSDYSLPFLMVGMLLSICIVGAVVLAKRRVD
jgi:NADH-quinone oxidoreductase subunit J